MRYWKRNGNYFIDYRYRSGRLGKRILEKIGR
jgi:hypothetical protein